jgi:peptide methionine sulfoxide reductase MsrA
VVATTGGTHTTIQAAINGLSGGTTAEPLYAIIEVREGSYAEYVQLTNSARRIALIAKPTTQLADVVLRGAGYSNNVLYITRTSVVSGFHITRQLDLSQPTSSHATGIYLSLSSATNQALIENCVIHGHRSSQAGALRIDQGDVTLRHVTMYDNAASVGNSYGNAVYINQGTLRVQNSIVWGQAGGAGNTIYRNPNYATVATTGSIVYGGEHGGLNTDPLINPLGLLKAGSPAINLGLTAVGTIKDKQGEIRLGLPDAGADEYVDSNGDGVPDNFGGGLATGNPDGDTLDNLSEYQYGSDPTLSDTDGDGLADGVEQIAGTNPRSDDSDTDGMRDAYEVANALNPLDGGDALLDKDGDLVPNLWEAKRGTEANNASSVPTANAVTAASGGTHTTIQAAINGLSGGTSAEPLYAIIEVREGSYAEYIQLTNSTRRIALIAKPTVSSAEVELRGAGYNNHVLYITQPSVVNGFRITRQLDASQPVTNHSVGIYVYLGNLTHQALIENCVIHGHRSSQAGALQVDQGDVTLRHVTMYDNIASVGNSYGNAVYINQGALRVQNSIVWGQAGGASNTIYRNPNYATVTTTGSIVYGGEHGGVNTDPLINPVGLLKSGSPAINLGVTAVGAIKDKQGEIRLGLPDAGADEFVDSNGDGVPDNFGGGLATGNPDGDTLDNLTEYQYGSNPTLSDTDGDGLADGVEQAAGTNPRSDDSDTDGMKDAYEVANALNPLDGADALLDKDGDLVPNLWEAKRGTEANNASSVPTANAVTAASGGTHTTIQAAINGLSGGTSTEPLYAIIEVREGSYAEYIQLTNNTRRIALIAKPTVSSAEVELRGGSYNNYVLYITQPSVVSGFRITRQLNPNQSAANHSTGVYLALGNSINRALIANCVIQGHRSSVVGGLRINQGDVTLRHVTMYDNLASNGSSYGNAIYIDQGVLRVQNSIIWGQAAGASSTIYRSGSYATVTVVGSIVYGGEHGGVNADPLINPLGLLRAGSPAINLGQAVIGTAKDRQAESRIGLPDAGADEFVDTDGDELADLWEIQHFGNLTSQTGGGDSDSDGRTNVLEYNRGTSPVAYDGVDQVVVSQSVDAASATPTATISFYSYTAQTVTLKFHKFYFEQSTVTNGFGAHHFDLIDTHTLSAHIGLNTYQWNGLIPGVSPTFHDADVVAVEVVSLGGPTPVSVGAPAAYIPASVFDGWSSSSNLYPATFGRLPYENTFLESNYSVTRPLMMVTPSCLSVLPRVPIVPGSNKLVRWVPMDDTGAGWATTNPDPTNVHAKELPVNAIVYLNNRPEVTDFTVQAFRTTPSNGEVVHARFSLSRATKVSLIMADPALMHSILYVRMPNGTYQEATDLELSAGSHDLEFRALNYDGGINDPRHFSYEKIRELSEAGLFRVRITWEQDVRIQDGYVQQATGFRWAYVHVQ